MERSKYVTKGHIRRQNSIHKTDRNSPDAHENEEEKDLRVNDWQNGNYPTSRNFQIKRPERSKYFNTELA